MGKPSLSVEMATADLLKLNPLETAARAGGLFDSQRQLLIIRFFDRPLAFDYGRQALIWGDSGEEFDPLDSIAVMHYLVNARGDQASGKLLAYRELWGAKAQSGPFIDRPEKMLAENYGQAPAAIINKAKELGAEVTEKYGDARLDLKVLPRLPICVLLYAADEELPAGAKILYDEVAGRYLPTEDCAWLADYVARRLCGQN